jgi:hypothetical protein
MPRYGTKRKAYSAFGRGSSYGGRTRKSFGGGYRVRRELKFVDIALAATTFANVATFGQINNIRQGAGFYQRVGTRINMRTLKIRGQIENNTPATANANERLRFAIIYDRQANGALPAFSDVFNNVPATGVPASLTWDFQSIVNKDRFLVLYDWAPQMADAVIPTGLGYAAPSNSFYPTMREMMLNLTINLHNLDTLYGADAGGIADCKTGSLLWMIKGEIGGVWAWTAQYRMQYDDNQ